MEIALGTGLILSPTRFLIAPIRARPIGANGLVSPIPASTPITDQRSRDPGGITVKLGLMTAAFSRLTLDQLASWSAANGYEMLEIACWPRVSGERRRYSGVSHIDVERLDPGRVRDVLDRSRLEISSLAYYPNNLHPDPALRRAANTHLKRVVDAAAALGVPTVGTFVGRDKTKSVPESFREFRKVWPGLVSYAESKGVRIA